MNDIQTAYDYIISKIGNIRPTVGAILGSGLGDFADSLENPAIVAFSDILGFPQSTVEGHSGQFVFGEKEGKQVVALKGRLHFYEGYDMQRVTLPVRIMALLGVKTLIVTNAAGGLNPGFQVGDLMLIRDHINYSGDNPLKGQNLATFGPRFPDCTNIYTNALADNLLTKTSAQGLKLQQGVYLMVSGPSYETPAEIKMFSQWGADAVGMSTVPETIVAAHCGIQVIGISCITNMAAGISEENLSHEEVIETAAMVKPNFIRVLDLAIAGA